MIDGEPLADASTARARALLHDAISNIDHAIAASVEEGEDVTLFLTASIAQSLAGILALQAER